MPIAPRKQADQPAAKSCSGLVPLPGVPGDESLMSSRPSEVRAAPSRPRVVWRWVVYSLLSIVFMMYSFFSCGLQLVVYTMGVVSYCNDFSKTPGTEMKAMKRKGSKHESCPIAKSLEAVGDAWSVLVVRDA